MIYYGAKSYDKAGMHTKESVISRKMTVRPSCVPVYIMEQEEASGLKPTGTGEIVEETFPPLVVLSAVPSEWRK